MVYHTSTVLLTYLSIMDVDRIVYLRRVKETQGIDAAIAEAVKLNAEAKYKANPNLAKNQPKNKRFVCYYADN